MHLGVYVLFAIFAAAFSAPSGKPLKVSLNVHKRFDSLEKRQQHLSALQARKGRGVIPLKGFSDMFYYGEVKMGTPGQTLYLFFDVDSSDLILPSSQICKRERNYCKNHRVYNERKSKTYKKVGKKWSTEMWVYRASGYTSNDTVEVGGLQVKNQMFGEATELEVILGTPFDGVLGLAFRSIAQIDTNSVFTNMIEQKVVDQPVFAFYLNKEGQTTGAELVLGGVDSSHYTGEFTYTPVTKQSYWFINIQGLTLDKKKIVGEYSTSLDPNTLLIYGPSEQTDKINVALNGQRQWDGSYVVDCSKISSFPDITFTISSKPFVLKPNEYTTKRHEDSEDVCYSGFFGFDDLTHFILGELFLRKYYTLFDMGQNRVGFATAK